MYLTGIETKFDREERNIDKSHGEQEDGLSIFSQKVCPFGATKYDNLIEEEFNMA